MSLKNQSYSAVRWTASSSVGKLVLQLVQLAILARLLDPSDYGLMAVVVIVLSIVSIFSDLGMSSAYVQRQQVSPEARSSLYWLHLIVSSVLCVALIAVSPALAWTLGKPELAPVLSLSAIVFILNALGQQIRMTAEKALRFRPVFFLEMTAGAFGLVCAVLAAMNGAGVYALVIGSLTGAAAGALFAWIFLAQGWRPMWRFSLGEIRQYLGFGGAMVGNSLVNQLNTSIDVLLGARFLGASQLGLYSVPRQLVLRAQFLVNSVVTRVGFPLIAQIQDDLPRVRKVYLKTLNMTASANAPLYLGLAWFAPEVVALMLGSGWSESSVLLRILALWGFVRSTGNPVGSLLFGMGRAKLALQWNIALLCVTAPALWFGARFGAEGVAWTLLALSVGAYIPAWYVLVRPVCGVRFRDYLNATGRPLLLAGAAVGAGYAAVSLWDMDILRLIVGALFSAVLYFSLSIRFNREWIGALRELAGWKVAAGYAI